ncbi:hydroxyacid dehydrogenase [Anaerococcus porci]|uniref:hydroxyacid dehydrogenase n=1 Tax=Anaerococcus porci TaxID=2652269 RepID=UPI002A752D06|nr:hydroxyacid dehydrogenase [Anaerococcus porci]MDY3006690.1 hydroxyacid dehydrogenase [Anaerococcus porci]
MYNFVITNPINNKALDIINDVGSYYLANDSNPNNYIEKMENADALIVSIASCDQNVIKNSHNLKVIGRTGVGYDTVDVNLATKYGIPVVITPGANSRSVAEATIGALFALSKKIIEVNCITRSGNWNRARNEEKFIELYGKTIGIVGVGNIGSIVANFCQSLGMRVIWYDPYVDSLDLKVEKCGIKYEEINKLIKDSDFISLHVPLTDETKNMISYNEFKLMKSSAYIINYSRGGLINEIDLIKALDDKLISGAAIDTFEKEPIDKNYPLLKSNKIIISPHSASQSDQAQINVAKMCIEGCLAILNRKKWPYVADINVYNHKKWKDCEWADI